MKKMILMAIVALSFGLSANVYAAGNAFTGAKIVQAGPTADANTCTILSQDVNLNASADVVAAWGCEAAANLAFGAACHAGGSTKTRSVVCSCTQSDVATPQGCAGTCSGGTYTPASPGEAVDVTGRVAFGGSTNGGSISAISLSGTAGAAVCNASTMSALSLFDTAD